MKALPSSLAAAALGGVLAAANCGGKAVMDGPPPGVGGVGNAGGTAGTGGTGSTASSTGTTSGSSSTTSTSTGPVGVLCQQTCALLAGCEVQADCAARCQATAPDCSAEQQAWLECLVALLEPAGCVPPLDCNPLFDEWRTCGLVWHSVSVTVNGDDGSCHSNSEIAGGTGQGYEIDCAWEPGAFACRCTVDSEPAGKCFENMSDPSGPCDPMEGCCASLFFVPFGPPD